MGAAPPFPGEGARRRRGPGAEEQEGDVGYLWVHSARARTTGGGLAAEGGGGGSSAPRWRRSGDREPR